MSLGLLPRVCAFGVPGQFKTHDCSGFENDVEDLVTDLPAAFVANDVPGAFCAPEVFVDAAMIASDRWVSMLGAALSAFEDAAMLCFSGVCVDLMKNDGFWERFLAFSGVLRIVANSGSSLFVSPCGLRAVRVLGLLAEMDGRCSCDIGVIAELNGGRCSCYIGVIAELIGGCSCVSGPGQAADLLCSDQCCDLFDHQDTHFSALVFLPVHTIISDGALGFAGLLEHVVAAALVSSGHSDFLVASAANAIEYMNELTAASVAAFLLDGQTDLLVAPAAQAYHFFEHRCISRRVLA